MCATPWPLTTQPPAPFKLLQGVGVAVLSAVLVTVVAGRAVRKALKQVAPQADEIAARAVVRERAKVRW